MATERVIMGIDPGSNIMGFGIIRVNGSKLNLVDLGVVKQGRTDDHFEKLKYIFAETIRLIELYTPHEFAIEAPFFGNNVQSMLKLGRAQGVAIAAALSRNLPVVEYSPRKVKQSVAGTGSASKEQIAAMCAHILQTPPFEVKHLDATDGLSVAICHALQNRHGDIKKGLSGWEAFLKQNPDRIK